MTMVPPPLQGGVRHRAAEGGRQQAQITTLMLRNIPPWYTQDLLLEEVSQVLCTSSTFDFFYLPWDSQKDQSMGYAFINFVSSAEAERCKLLFANHVFQGGQGRKPCRVCYAHVQGLMNNVRHLMDRAVAEAQIHYPIIVWEGQRLKLGEVVSGLGQAQSRLSSHAVSNSILSSDSLAHAPWADHVMRKAIAEAQSEDGSSSDLLQDSASSNSSVTWDSSCGVPPPLKLLSSDFVASVSTSPQDWSATSGSTSSGSQHQSNVYSHSPQRPPKATVEMAALFQALLDSQLDRSNRVAASPCTSVLNCADDDVSLEHQSLTNVHRRRQHFADCAYPSSFAIPPADSRVFRSLGDISQGYHTATDADSSSRVPLQSAFPVGLVNASVGVGAREEQQMFDLLQATDNLWLDCSDQCDL